MNRFQAIREPIGGLRLPPPPKKAQVCPVCCRLECLCRPRYFSGQLLTEADLNAEQQWAIKKNRLHNLYLHGWGVVCGLEVVCHPTCDGWVTVKTGYGISPCGDDVIVCDDHDFDVLKAIDDWMRRCRDTGTADCTPRPTTRADCDTDGCWLLRICYEETATRGVTPLRPETQKSAPLCSCGTRNCTSRGCCGGRDCGCGQRTASMTKTMKQMNGSGRTAMTMTAAPPLATCEPTRWCEGYRLELCKAPPEPPDQKPNYWDLIEGTLLGDVLACKADLQAVLALAPQPNANTTNEQLYSQCCRFLAEVRTFVKAHPSVHCAGLNTLLNLQCPPVPADNQIVGVAGLEPGGVVGQPYPQQIANVVAQVQTQLGAYMLECICMNILPHCPEDPGDECLTLACITVKDGEVTDICNWKGRKIVLSWPTVQYWLSITPALMKVLEKLCCGEYGTGFAENMIRPGVGQFNAAFMAQPANELQVLQQLTGFLSGGLSSFLQTGGL
jgi:hypothetical protein